MNGCKIKFPVLSINSRTKLSDSLYASVLTLLSGLLCDILPYGLPEPSIELLVIALLLMLEN